MKKTKLIKTGEYFYIKSIKAFSHEDFIIDYEKNGYFILDMWNQCSEPDINIYPVKYVECENNYEFYILKTDNIILGRGEDVC